MLIMKIRLGGKVGTVLNVAGVVLGLVGSALSSVAQHKIMKSTIAEEVAKTAAEALKK
jgi:hypothetical protein